ncbi:GW dipeptide domain-containing protein [Lacticaseibacillus daqingensis]|uniref:GW dipeptide domain-containing protein n=1 Tax=Lacticaseibacillus daqingensis TaxID=2486014 RepID=UPI000F778DCC|nr:GW dipeptide domain-containing protein [Lacticaseibacillus daqingensis]
MKKFPVFICKAVREFYSCRTVKALLFLGMFFSLSVCSRRSLVVNAIDSENQDISFALTNHHKDETTSVSNDNKVIGSSVASNIKLNESDSTDIVHRMTIPAGLSLEMQGQWLALAQERALADIALTSRAQQIIQLASQPATIQIGNSLYPRADVIDVASYQYWMNQADFNQLRNLGVSGLVVKLTQGTGYENPYATNQISYALAAGMAVSAYHYATFNSVTAARAEANHFLASVKSHGLPMSTTLVADMEDGLVAGDVASELKAFWQVLSDAGYNQHVVYTGGGFAAKNAAIATVGEAKTWYAQYPYDPRATNLWNTNYGAWQFSSTALFPGAKSSVDVSIDYRGLFTRKYDPILSSGLVDYDATIDQSTRADGVYTGPYNTSYETSQPNVDGKKYDKAFFHAIEEATTRTGTYVKGYANGTLIWIQKMALVDPVYEKILSSENISGFFQIDQSNRADGIWADGPYMTSGTTSSPNTDGLKYSGRIVTALQRDITTRGVFDQIKLSTGETFWIDERALKAVVMNEITGDVDVTGKVYRVDQTIRADGIYSAGPYMTSLETISPNTGATAYSGVLVKALQAKQTTMGVYVQVQTESDGKTFWIDQRGLAAFAMNEITGDVDVTGKVYRVDQTIRADGIYSAGPYMTSLETISPNTGATAYSGVLVKALQAKQTTMGVYVQVQTESDGKTFWIDQRGLAAFAMNEITGDVDVTGKVYRVDQTIRADGIYSAGPYMTSLETISPNTGATAYSGVLVKALQAKQTTMGVYVQVQVQQTGLSFWIDVRGLEEVQ